MNNIYQGTGWNRQLVGCYDDDSIYILKQVYSRERVAYYNKQEIKNNDFIPTTIAYCKENKLYDSMLLSNYLGYYNNGCVYDRYGTAIGEYEGVNGQCAGALLLVTELSNKIYFIDANKISNITNGNEVSYSNSKLPFNSKPSYNKFYSIFTTIVGIVAVIGFAGVCLFGFLHTAFFEKDGQYISEGIFYLLPGVIMGIYSSFLIKEKKFTNIFNEVCVKVIPISTIFSFIIAYIINGNKMGIFTGILMVPFIIFILIIVHSFVSIIFSFLIFFKNRLN